MKQLIISVCLTFIIMTSATGCIGIKKISNNTYTLDFSKTPYVAYKKWHSNYGAISLMQQRIGSEYALFIERFKKPLKLKTAKIESTCIYRLNGFDALKIEGTNAQGSRIHEVISIRKGKATTTVVDAQNSMVAYKVSNNYKSLIQAHITQDFQRSYFYSFTAYRCSGPNNLQQLKYDDLEYFQNQHINYSSRQKVLNNTPKHSAKHVPPPSKSYRDTQLTGSTHSYRPLPKENDDMIPTDKIRTSSRIEKIHVKID